MTRPRGRPPHDDEIVARERFAIEQAMLAVLALREGRLLPRAGVGPYGRDNIRRAAALAAKLLTAIHGRGVSTGSVLRVWYSKSRYKRPPEERTEGIDCGTPLSIKVAARILNAAGPEVRPGAVLDWYRQRLAADRVPPPFHPFELAIAYAEDHRRKYVSQKIGVRR